MYPILLKHNLNTLVLVRAASMHDLISELDDDSIAIRWSGAINHSTINDTVFSEMIGVVPDTGTFCTITRPSGWTSKRMGGERRFPPFRNERVCADHSLDIFVFTTCHESCIVSTSIYGNHGAIIMKSVLSASLLAISSALASGSVFESDELLERVSSVQLASGIWSTEVDVSGIRMIDALGDPDNDFLTLFHIPKDPKGNPPDPSANTLLSFEYNLVLTTIEPSWGADASINLGDEVDFNFAPEYTSPVDNQTINGIIPLDELGNTIDFGYEQYSMRIEFYENFQDSDGIAEAYFEEGSMFTFYTQHVAGVAVPAPGGLGCLCFASMSVGRRRRE